MELNIAVVTLLLTVLSALAHSTVGQRGAYYPYPAAVAGSKPLRQLPLVAAQPSRTYGAPPATAPAAAPVPAPAPAQPKPARLVANSEAQEDIDDAVEQVAVNKAVAPAPVPAAAPSLAIAPSTSAIVQPTIAYYPAQFGGFIQPTTFARLTATAAVPAAAAPSVPYVARYPYYAAYFG